MIKKEYNSPEFELFVFSFEKILEEGGVLDPSGGEIGQRIGDDNGPNE